MPQTILADTGIPMLFWQMPFAIAAFIPIVAIEALVAWIIVRKPIGLVIRRVTIANAASTFVGIPIAWLFMVVVENATRSWTKGMDTPWHAFQSIVMSTPWVLPDWMVPPYLGWYLMFATLVLLVPYFFVSVLVERWVLVRGWRDVPRLRVALAAWVGNLITYAALGLWAWCQLQRAAGG